MHIPISSISTEINAGVNWTIKVRVAEKSEISTWQNDNGSGKLFSADLVDKDGKEIRIVFFNDDADKYQGTLAVGNVYEISNAYVKEAHEKYNDTNSKFELSASKKTKIQQAEDDKTIPAASFTFVPIGDIQQLPEKKTVDVLGVVTNVGQLDSVTTKAGALLPKRVITIADTSAHSIEQTLWAREAEKFDAPTGALVAVKGSRVSEYANRSLSGCKRLLVNPDDVPAGKKVRKWFDERGDLAQIRPLTCSTN